MSRKIKRIKAQKRHLSRLFLPSLGVLLLAISLGAFGSVALGINIKSLLAQGAAPAMGKETKKELCNNAYVFENAKQKKPQQTAKGKLPFKDDVYKERLAFYQKNKRPDAVTLAKNDVDKGVNEKKICDGERVCGASFYQDLDGGDRIVCQNRCEKAFCDNALKELRTRVASAAGKNMRGTPLNATEQLLPRWALENPRDAFNAINSHLYGPGINEAFSPERLNQESAELMLNQELAEAQLVSRGQSPYDKTLAQLVSMGKNILPASQIPPPPLIPDPGEITGRPFTLDAPEAPQNRTGAVPTNNTNVSTEYAGFRNTGLFGISSSGSTLRQRFAEWVRNFLSN